MLVLHSGPDSSWKFHLSKKLSITVNRLDETVFILHSSFHLLSLTVHVAHIPGQGEQEPPGREELYCSPKVSDVWY